MSAYASIPLMPVFSRLPPSANRVGFGSADDGLVRGRPVEIRAGSRDCRSANVNLRDRKVLDRG